jgi:hypothetical protein
MRRKRHERTGDRHDIEWYFAVHRIGSPVQAKHAAFASVVPITGDRARQEEYDRDPARELLTRLEE